MPESPAAERTPMDEGESLVALFESEMAHGHTPGTRWVVLTPAVQQRMAELIAGKINDAINRTRGYA